MIQIKDERNLLDQLRKNGKFLTTHGKIKDFFKNNYMPPNEFIDFDYELFSIRTQKNLKTLSDLFNWKWKYVIKYKASPKRHGHFVYGIGKNNRIVNFHRKETNCPVAGQTVCHIGNKSVQVSKLVNIEAFGEKQNN